MAGHKVLIGHHAALFDRVSGVALQWLYRRVAQQVSAGVPPGGSVLDVGTGPGHLLVEMARRRPDIHVCGVDPSADMVGHATSRSLDAGLSERVDVRVGAAEKLPFNDARFDAVVSTLSAHHWTELAPSVTEQARVLRAGGSIWVVDLRRAPVRDVTELLRAQSFVVSPAHLGRVVSTVLVGLQAQRV